MSDVVVHVQELVEPILRSRGLGLWDIEFQRHGPRWLLRVYIDRPEGGVTLDDCEAVSRDLGAALDVDDVIDHAYTLEVSSPGLDRTLTRPEHFAQSAGRAVKIKTFEPVNEQRVFQGTLRGLGEGNTVRVEIEPGKVIELALGNVAKASLEVEL